MTDSDALMLIRGKIQCDIKSWTSVDGHGIIVEFRFPGKNLESYIEFDYPHNHLYFEILDMTDYKDGELIPLDSFRRKFIINAVCKFFNKKSVQIVKADSHISD